MSETVCPIRLLVNALSSMHSPGRCVDSRCNVNCAWWTPAGCCVNQFAQDEWKGDREARKKAELMGLVH